MTKLSTIAGLISLLLLILFDARYHFDKEFVEVKQQHFSDQRIWSIFYKQNEVYEHGALTYLEDFAAISLIIEDHSTVLSDLATSYYASVLLPRVKIPNIHRHHGSLRRPSWSAFVKKRYACYIEHPENLQRLQDFKEQQRSVSSLLGFDYILLNSDSVNRNLKSDCLAQRSKKIAENLPLVADLVFTGKYLSLWKLR
ncbi:MAG: hypothetical protein AAF431_09240 [Pseudomonadota bacterium]